MLSGWFFGVWQAPPEPDWGQAASDDEDEDQKERTKAAAAAAKSTDTPQQQSMMEKMFGNRAVKEVGICS